MDELISKQAAIDAILHNEEVYSHNYGDDPIDGYTVAIINNDAQTLAQLPAIDPVKRGKWITMSDADGVYWSCSECGEDIPRVAHYNPQFDLFPRLESIDKTNYCPHCGARMNL